MLRHTIFRYNCIFSPEVKQNKFCVSTCNSHYWDHYSWRNYCSKWQMVPFTFCWLATRFCFKIVLICTILLICFNLRISISNYQKRKKKYMFCVPQSNITRIIKFEKEVLLRRAAERATLNRFILTATQVKDVSCQETWQGVPAV